MSTNKDIADDEAMNSIIQINTTGDNFYIWSHYKDFLMVVKIDISTTENE